MANRPEVLSTKNTSPETPMQFAACRNVGRAILPAGPISIGPSRRKGGQERLRHILRYFGRTTLTTAGRRSMMLDAYIVAVSPPGCGGRPDFEQPLAAHQHSHIDVSCIHISAKFYYLRSSRDGVAAATS